MKIKTPLNFANSRQQAGKSAEWIGSSTSPFLSKKSSKTQGGATEHSSAWKFSEIIENIDVGIVILDLENRAIEYRNPSFYQVLASKDLSSDYEGLYQLLIQDLELTEETPQLGSVSGTVDLNERLLRCTVYHIADRYRCIFIHDITEKRRLQTIAQAVNAMDNLGFIFSGIRHEIGNPLNSLKMTLSVLKQNLNTFVQDNIDEYIDRSLSDIGRIEYLLKSLKSFSMFEHVEMTEVSFGPFMDSFLSLTESGLKQRKVDFSIIESTWPEVIVKIDQRAMHQVMLNILTNAVDAVEDLTNPEIRISTNVKDNLLWVTIHDNGRGISLEQQKHLFQPFNSSKQDGNGLGLVIAQKLLALMDSSIEIESGHDQGTSVTISLPVSGHSN